MKVKVQCPCGTRFEFEVEPVNGRMPVAINCPVCNADATELANAVISQQPAGPVPVGIVLAPVSPPPAPPPAPAPPPPPASPPASGLRIARSTAHPAPAPAPAPVPVPGDTAAPPASEDAPAPPCPKHKSESAVDNCVVCGKPICLKCMEQFGHVCSVYCAKQAELKRIYVPAYAGQKSVIAEKAGARAKLISLSVAAVLIAFLGLWFWYAWFARNPKIVFSLTLGDKNEMPEQRLLRPPQFYKLIAPNQLLSIKNKQASLLDVTKNQPLWSTPLQDDSAKSAPDKKIESTALALAEAYGFSDPLVAVTSNDLWLAFPSQLVRLDRQTGARKDNSLHGGIMNFSRQGDSLVAVVVNSDGQSTLARVNLSDGNIQTAPLDSPAVAKPAPKVVAAKKPANDRNDRHANRAGRTRGDEKTQQVQIATAVTTRELPSEVPTARDSAGYAEDPPDAAVEGMSIDFNGDEIPAFTASGSGVVRMQSRLLEQKSITHQAMKAKGKSVLDGNVTASQGLDLAQEMMNDSQRNQTGGVEIEDVSRYQVTLHRWFAGEMPDWSGEVTGPPRFYALKSMDLLVAGQSVTALDRNNKKLWEGKLSYPMNYSGDHPPVLETADAVYVADPGVLTCFDRATGGARWRLNSVGISSVLTDARGKIYLTTTTAGPEKIKFSQEHNVREKIHPVIVKVDPATGKVLWRQESLGDECLVSGKFLYSTWATQSQSALKLEEGPDTHFNIDLLSPSSGDVIWNFHIDNQAIVQTDVQQNWILLRFENKLYVLKFFSL